MKTQTERAKEIGVTRQAFSSWVQKDAPVEDDHRLAVWLLNQERITAKVRAWCNKVIKANTPRSNRKPKDDDSEEMKSLEDILEFYMRKLNEATLSGENLESIKFWNEHAIKTGEAIRRSEAHAKKLGLQDGTTLSREEVERILRAVFYAGNGCTQGVLTTACEKWASINDPGELFHAMKPVIVGGRLFSGFSKVVTTEGAPQIPDWVMQCVTQEAEQYLSSLEGLWVNER